jgi:tRNA A37 threonylcarbamoyladenosine modification protein TsaB
VTGSAIVGVSTLAAIAHTAGESAQTVSLLPAGRGEVFAQMFRVKDGAVRHLDEAAHLTPQETWQKYGHQPGMRWAGEGVVKISEYLALSAATTEQEIVGEVISASDSLAAVSGSLALAPSIAALALRDYREGKSVTADELRAVYVRASDAEINQRWQQQNLQRQGRN